MENKLNPRAILCAITAAERHADRLGIRTLLNKKLPELVEVVVREYLDALPTAADIMRRHIKEVNATNRMVSVNKIGLKAADQKLNEYVARANQKATEEYYFAKDLEEMASEPVAKIIPLRPVQRRMWVTLPCATNDLPPGWRATRAEPTVRIPGPRARRNVLGLANAG